MSRSRPSCGSLVPADHPLFVLTEGKMIIEIRPRVDWNKGTAVRWIQDRLQADGALPFIIGDDRTDEDAFDAIDDAVTIRVGPEESTVAQYCLPDQEAVGEMLHWLLGVWKERRAVRRETSRSRMAGRAWASRSRRPFPACGCDGLPRFGNANCRGVETHRPDRGSRPARTPRGQES